ncbi:MAG TPA: hypothetical protein PLQ93_08515 [Bacteroidia bacterium]|nr:hypothetical protein [Bacteroidia bacterium]
MNPVTIASILLLMLASLNGARANNAPLAPRKINYSSQIRSQMQVENELAQRLNASTVRFYFTVDSSGMVNQVRASVHEPGLRKILEEKFRKIKLQGYPANQPSSIDLHFVTQ